MSLFSEQYEEIDCWLSQYASYYWWCVYTLYYTTYWATMESNCFLSRTWIFNQLFDKILVWHRIEKSFRELKPKIWKFNCDFRNDLSPLCSVHYPISDIHVKQFTAIYFTHYHKSKESIRSCTHSEPKLRIPTGKFYQKNKTYFVIYCKVMNS